MKSIRFVSKAVSGLLALSLLFLMAGCNDGASVTADPTGSGSSGASGSSGSAGAADGEKPAFTEVGANGSRTDDPLGFQLEMPEQGEEIAVFHTNMGDIYVRLFPEDAPIAVTNFKALVKEGYYDGLTFHRVIEDFMIQGGDPEGTGMGGESIWGEGFEYEFNDNLLHFTGALSMAHSAQPDSNGSQFFIVQGAEVTAEQLEASGYTQAMSQDSIEMYEKHGGAYWLDGQVNSDGHTVFGQVFDGMDVVDAIAAVQTDSSDKPVEDVIMESVELVTYEG